jgi:hypothetical protein
MTSPAFMRAAFWQRGARASSILDARRIGPAIYEQLPIIPPNVDGTIAPQVVPDGHGWAASHSCAQCAIPDVVRHARPAPQSVAAEQVAPSAPGPVRRQTVSLLPAVVPLSVLAMLHAMPAGQSVPNGWQGGVQLPDEGIVLPMTPTHTEPIVHWDVLVHSGRHARMVALGEPRNEQISPGAQSS